MQPAESAAAVVQRAQQLARDACCFLHRGLTTQTHSLFTPRHVVVSSRARPSILTATRQPRPCCQPSAKAPQAFRATSSNRRTPTTRAGRRRRRHQRPPATSGRRRRPPAPTSDGSFSERPGGGRGRVWGRMRPETCSRWRREPSAAPGDSATSRACCKTACCCSRRRRRPLLPLWPRRPGRGAAARQWRRGRRGWPARRG
jgi:hypothetical protein